MSERITVINVSHVVQVVSGYGEAAPGKDLSVDARVASPLLKGEAGDEPKAAKKEAGHRATAPAPAEDSALSHKGKEVSNGAD
ncbi:MAG: hypothetical protein K9K36_16565 [Desulfarculaceae bacterium]|nr:hypothetical protein [Desulfarculaceae bacterium]